MFRIGCHLSFSGGYMEAGKTILSIGGNTFQYFTKNPRGRTDAKTITDKEIEDFINLMQENDMVPPLAHAPYTYNPCSDKPEIREYTRDSMAREIAGLERIPGSMYNFHPGCHLKQGVDVGIAYIDEMLNSVMTKDMKTTILLETMAGKGSEIGRSFDELRQIIDGVNEDLRPHIGVCLDTCHISDGGYDIINDLDGVIKEFDSVVGLDRLHAIHLNDSKNPLGAHKDRHEKIGLGCIGQDTLAKVINHEALRDLPFYLETPNEPEGYAQEIALLKSLRKE